MKIAMILRHYSRYGSSKYALETTKYFVKKGHEVHVFANKWSNKVKGVYFHKIPIFTSNFFLQELSFLLIATLTLKKYKFDITYSQPGRYFSPKVAGVHICHKAWAMQQKPRNFIEWLANKLLVLIETYNLRKAKKIIAVSNSIKKELIKYYHVSPEKIHVAYDGVNLKEFSPKNKIYFRKKLRKKYKVSSNEFLLLFIGVPFKRKGLEYVIRSLPYIPQTKLFVIGKESPTFYKELAFKLGVDNRITFLKFVEKISQYFAAADIFVLPTLYEPFGLVVLEAMASGLPVVVSETAGAAELIEDGKDGLLVENPKNPEEIAEKINYLLENDSLRKRIGRNARKKAEKYPWSRTAEEMLKVFEEVAKNSQFYYKKVNQSKIIK
jgi:UDP-glucose:(heptosyl)LPS alpha-1,3-glucosyltransferase